MNCISINKLKPLEELQFSSYTQISLQFHWCVRLVPQSCPTLCNPMDSSLSGSSVDVILQARILVWVAIPFSRGSS